MSGSFDELDRGLRDAEGRLRALAPSAGGLSRDRVLFEAGREAGQASARAGMLRALAGLGVVGMVATGILWQGERAARIEAQRALAAVREVSSERQESLVVVRGAGPNVARVDDPTTYLALRDAWPRESRREAKGGGETAPGRAVDGPVWTLLNGRGVAEGDL